MAIGHQHMLRAIIADLESQHGAAAVLPITTELSKADEKLRDFYQNLATTEAVKWPRIPLIVCNICDGSGEVAIGYNEFDYCACNPKRKGQSA